MRQEYQIQKMSKEKRWQHKMENENHKGRDIEGMKKKCYGEMCGKGKHHEKNEMEEED